MDMDNSLSAKNIETADKPPRLMNIRAKHMTEMRQRERPNSMTVAKTEPIRLRSTTNAV